MISHTELRLAIPGRWDRAQLIAVLDLLDTLYDAICMRYEETLGGGCSPQIPLPLDGEDAFDDDIDF